MWITGLTLVLALGADPGLDTARAELSDVAVRIEQLKVEHLHGRDVGRELERLLVRAQELAVEIDRRTAAVPAPGAVAPSAEELRERADALHDEADRLAGALTDLDVRIAALRRATAPSTGRSIAAVATVRRASVSGAAARSVAPPSAGPSLEETRLRQLLADRDALAARLAHVRAAAAAVEADARAAEQ
ncbi:hypothetical protein [Anaeromyxobacter oryzae]|uniref:Uncharacterized protein n=1 Tax=Anaeromyxobacter oryzae TaxID=2918170 RepID=A0ABM7WV61_9BACT|nr:hypothetical protein [Anaeromyxobacter oryzae]BDG03371.1 hypothetical protein AMOR_23670 [Anaeromyxobacter oryzae]